MKGGTGTTITIRGLLRDLPAGLPADCLLARIKGRRSFLVRDWDRLLLARSPLEALTAAPWRERPSAAVDGALSALQQEYYWTFAHMDEDLRHATAPFFWLEEVHTLAISLRLLSNGRTNLDPLLHASLLANPLKSVLRGADNGNAALNGVATYLSGYDRRFTGLTEIYQREGHGALETALYEISLLALLHGPLHPALRSYLTLRIDSRNLTTIAKRLRWRLTTLPPLIAGGTLPLRRLEELFVHRDQSGLLRLALHLGGTAPYSESDDPEKVLYEAQGRVMRRLARAADGIGAILDYLWRCHNEAISIALLARLETAGSAAINGELRR